MSYKIGSRVSLIQHPDKYQNYQGTLTGIYALGRDIWAIVEWDMPVHPCTSPIMLYHVKPVEESKNDYQAGMVTLNIVDETPEFTLDYSKRDVLSRSEATKLKDDLDFLLESLKHHHGVDGKKS